MDFCLFTRVRQQVSACLSRQILHWMSFLMLFHRDWCLLPGDLSLVRQICEPLHRRTTICIIALPVMTEQLQVGHIQIRQKHETTLNEYDLVKLHLNWLLLMIKRNCGVQTKWGSAEKVTATNLWSKLFEFFCLSELRDTNKSVRLRSIKVFDHNYVRKDWFKWTKYNFMTKGITIFWLKPN